MRRPNRSAITWMAGGRAAAPRSWYACHVAYLPSVRTDEYCGSSRGAHADGTRRINTKPFTRHQTRYPFSLPLGWLFDSVARHRKSCARCRGEAQIFRPDTPALTRIAAVRCRTRVSSGKARTCLGACVLAPSRVGMLVGQVARNCCKLEDRM